MLLDHVDLVDSLVFLDLRDHLDPLVCLEYPVHLVAHHREENRVYKDLLDLRYD